MGIKQFQGGNSKLLELRIEHSTYTTSKTKRDAIQPLESLNPPPPVAVRDSGHKKYRCTSFAFFHFGELLSSLNIDDHSAMM